MRTLERVYEHLQAVDGSTLPRSLTVLYGAAAAAIGRMDIAETCCESVEGLRALLDQHRGVRCCSFRCVSCVR
jgi:hypothetical protein